MAQMQEPEAEIVRLREMYVEEKLKAKTVTEAREKVAKPSRRREMANVPCRIAASRSRWPVRRSRSAKLAIGTPPLRMAIPVSLGRSGSRTARHHTVDVALQSRESKYDSVQIYPRASIGHDRVAFLLLAIAKNEGITY